MRSVVATAEVVLLPVFVITFKMVKLGMYEVLVAKCPARSSVTILTEVPGQLQTLLNS